ncbi:MAG: hypothetical protein ACTHKG_06245 [Nocardioides sp.]
MARATHAVDEIIAARAIIIISCRCDWVHSEDTKGWDSAGARKRCREAMAAHKAEEAAREAAQPRDLMQPLLDSMRQARARRIATEETAMSETPTLPHRDVFAVRADEIQAPDVIDMGALGRGSVVSVTPHASNRVTVEVAADGTPITLVMGSERIVTVSRVVAP